MKKFQWKPVLLVSAAVGRFKTQRSRTILTCAVFLLVFSTSVRSVCGNTAPECIGPTGIVTATIGSSLTTAHVGFDDDGDSMVLSASGAPPSAIFQPPLGSIVEPGQFVTLTYTPTSGEAGASFNVTVSFTDTGGLTGSCFYTIQVDPGADQDLDGIADGQDNCPTTPNPDQIDSDTDGSGDVCDADDDNDGVPDELDNCPLTANANQSDLDGDGVGDACDPDDDNDGVADPEDNCVATPNLDQADNDSDGLGDACDPDDDNDSVPDESDNCPFVPNLDQADFDGDGLGDPCDQDLDGDGVPTDVDNCPTVANGDQADEDNDGQGNACDADDDNDGVPDTDDACPLRAATPDVDADSNGCPDNVADLSGFVRSLGLPRGIEQSLAAIAESAARQSSKQTASNILDAFILHVAALKGDKIPEDQADQLIAFARNAKAAL